MVLVLQALCKHYDFLKSIKKNEIPSRGYSYAGLSYALVINQRGQLKDIIDLREEDNKNKLRPVMRLVPEQKKRTGKNPPAYFLCDNAKYVLGYSCVVKKKEVITEEITVERFQLFYDCHKKVLQCNHPVMLFLENWDPNQASKHPIIKNRIEQLDFKGNFVFFIEETGVYPHNDEQLVNQYMQIQNNDDMEQMNCLITGEWDNISRIHTAIKGVRGAQSAGANIIGFNNEAFCSYGKTQSYNAPVSETAMFKYTTALNYMLAKPQYHYSLADQTIVFWAKEQDKTSAIIHTALFGNTENRLNKKESSDMTQMVKDLLIKAKFGLKPACEMYNLEPDQEIYILGLSPNNARLSVSLWQVNSLAYFIERLSVYYEDLDIVGIDDIVSIWKITNETVPKSSKDKKISPLIEKGLLDAVLEKDKLYPVALYYAILNRIKAERYINSTRAATIKAYLNRKKRITMKGEGLPVALDKYNQSEAYQMGRLFAVLEKIQREAIVGIKNTIKESYFSSVLASPAVVFPRLIKVSTFHTAKLKSRKHYHYYEKEKSDIIANIQVFPKRLTLDQQGEFVVGYYHQNHEIYLSKEEREKETN